MWRSIFQCVVWTVFVGSIAVPLRAQQKLIPPRGSLGDVDITKITARFAGEERSYEIVCAVANQAPVRLAQDDTYST